LSINGKEYKVLCYYREPTTDSFSPFILDVEKELSEGNAHTMIIGDVNLDANSDNKSSSEYINLLKSYDMKVTNKNMTRNASGRIIDHMTI
jgi:GTP1/Obg family GTP-binding protein